MSEPLRVVLTGSECVGKTTLSGQIAAHFGALAVPEFSRDYAAMHPRALDLDDAVAIAEGHLLREAEYLATAREAGHALLVYDTDLVSTVAYCHHYHGRCPAFIEQAARMRLADQYLLPDIDVPWVADGIRDRGDRREEVQALFAETLARLGARVHVLRGNWDARFTGAVSVVQSLLAAPRA
jgi:nicotinamide riboside kinase